MEKFINTRFVKLKALKSAPELKAGTIVCFARKGSFALYFYQVQGNGYVTEYEFSDGEFIQYTGMEIKKLSTKIDSAMLGLTDLIPCAVPEKIKQLVINNVHNPFVDNEPNLATF